MQRLSYPTETVLSNKITRNRIVLSFKDSPRKPLGRRPHVCPRPHQKPQILPAVESHACICGWDSETGLKGYCFHMVTNLTNICFIALLRFQVLYSLLSNTACGHRIAHRKWKETKQQPSMLPGPAVPGCSLVSFHFLLAILCPQAVEVPFHGAF